MFNAKLSPKVFACCGTELDDDGGGCCGGGGCC